MSLKSRFVEQIKMVLKKHGHLPTSRVHDILVDQRRVVPHRNQVASILSRRRDEFVEVGMEGNRKIYGLVDESD